MPKAKVLITGASRGIGWAVSKKFAENGFVVITPTRQELDLSSEISVKNFIAKNSDLKIDVLINNAGINIMSLLNSNISNKKN